MSALVSIRDGEVRTTSQDVASAFEKEHRDVVRAIDNLLELGGGDVRNFAHIEFRDGGNRRRLGYEMDRDGFALLAMGFTGGRALKWKLKFLDAFKQMEQALSRSLASNDNGLAQLHPLLQSPEGRDALWKGREQVRLMKELKGREAAMALWIELGLPLPRDFDAYLEHGNKTKPVVGELFAWVSERGLRRNDAVITAAETLWDDYFNWCHAIGATAYEPDKFKWHLRNHFGRDAEARRGQFLLEITKG